MKEVNSQWDATTKRIVSVILLALFALILYQFRALLPPLIIALLLAFILDPLVDFLEDRIGLSRAVGTILVFAVGILVVLTAPVVLVPPLVRAVRSLNLDFAQISASLDRLMDRTVTVFGQTWDLHILYEDLITRVEDFFSLPGQLSNLLNVALGTVDIVVGFATMVFWLVFTLLAVFYLLRDADRIIAAFDDLVPSGFREDFIRLRRQITGIWHGFLRGQLLMGVLMTALTASLDAVVGLPNALALGILAGVMEFVPSIGPVIAAVPAVAVALIQGSTWLPLSNFWFAVLVLGLYLLIQQIEGNLLLPRVMGRTLNLHPLVVLVAVIAGGSVAGILGLLLAAPMVATFLAMANYVYCRLTDRDPFPEVPRAEPQRVGVGRRIWDWMRSLVLARRWKVRPARAEDRPQAEAISEAVWQGEKVISEVWDEWLADSEGQLSVVELEGQVVAFGKLTCLEEDEWWLEGLQVDPRYQRLGLERLLLGHQVRVAERAGRGVLRFSAHSDHRGTSRIATKHGFLRVAELLYFRGEPLPGPCPLELLSAGDVETVWPLIEGSLVYEATAGLYELSWHWKNFTPERLTTHLENDEVWGLRLEERLAGVAILPPNPHSDLLYVGYVTGNPESIIGLAWGLRVLARERQLERGVEFKLPSHPSLVEAAEAGGVSRAWEYALWIFERPLKGENERGRARD